MLLFKYTKKDNAAYLPHLDLLRMFGRVFRRADIPVKFSEGFNPHMLLYFCPPLAVGLSSTAEYCAVDCLVDAETFMQKFNANSTEQVQITFCKATAKNPNLAAVTEAASYELVFLGAENLAETSKKLISSAVLEIEFSSKGKTEKKDFRKGLFTLSVSGQTVSATLGLNDKSLRADRLAAHILTLCGGEILSITRTEQFFKKDGGFKPVSELG